MKTTNSDDTSAGDRSTRCCFVRLMSENREELINLYNGQNWTSEGQTILPLKCFISRVKLDKDEAKGLVELKPPTIMPCGNVGTPTSYFLEQIKLCRMPPAVIKKLRLKFPKISKRLYSSVPPPECLDRRSRRHFDADREGETSEENPTTSDAHNNSEEEEETEEWDRHNALWDNVTEQVGYVMSYFFNDNYDLFFII